MYEYKTELATSNVKRTTEQLRQHNIVVRFFKKPRIDAYIRVTIGSDNEMIALVDALKEILLQRR